MKGFKTLIMLAAVATALAACSKKSDPAPAPPPKEETRYYYQGSYCYDRETGNRVSNSFCDDDYNNGGGYQNACVGWVYYTNYQAGYMDRVDCRNPNAIYVECRDPEAYVRAGEVYHCEETTGGYY